ADGDLARVASRRGALHVIAGADASLRSGQAYVPMHWGKRFLGGRDSAGINTVTNAAFDPISRQPELKHAAVRVVAADLSWRVVVFADCPSGKVSGLVDRLPGLLDEVVFCSADS